MVGSTGRGEAYAPGEVGVGGHDTELCSRPLSEGRGYGGVRPPCLQPPLGRRLQKATAKHLRGERRQTDHQLSAICTSKCLQM